MTVQTKTIGRMPTHHGDYDPSVAYGNKYRVTLYGCEWESKHDNNNTAPATWDGGDTITPNTTDWELISESRLCKPADLGAVGFRRWKQQPPDKNGVRHQVRLRAGGGYYSW